MIRLPSPAPADRRRARWLAKRHWRVQLVPFAILDVEDFGRVLVIGQRLETRWSDIQNRRLWRVVT